MGDGEAPTVGLGTGLDVDGPGDADVSSGFSEAFSEAAGVCDEVGTAEGAIAGDDGPAVDVGAAHAPTSNAIATMPVIFTAPLPEDDRTASAVALGSRITGRPPRYVRNAAPDRPWSMSAARITGNQRKLKRLAS